MNHFEGKAVPEHLKEARKRGLLASAEVHGTEMAGAVGAFTDAAKESALYLLILWLILYKLALPIFSILLFFSIGLLIWKSGRSALLGWARLERHNRMTEEERWEIEHHPAQEKEELKELYLAKGFEGKLLDEVVDVLMADDNRLLNVMLEEELGVTLEAYDHPLKQAAGAAGGVVVATAPLLLLFSFFPMVGIPVGAALLLGASSVFSAKQERNQPLTALIWNFATAAFACGILFFIIS